MMMMMMFVHGTAYAHSSNENGISTTMNSYERTGL